MSEFDDLIKRKLFVVAKELQAELQRVVPVDTGRLKNSINVEAGADELIIKMVDYGLDVEFGTNPHTVSEEQLKGWARRKLGDEKLAGAVSAKIARFGTRPQPFIRTTIFTKLPEIMKTQFNKK